ATGCAPGGGLGFCIAYPFLNKGLVPQHKRANCKCLCTYRDSSISSSSSSSSGLYLAPFFNGVLIVTLKDLPPTRKDIWALSRPTSISKSRPENTLPIAAAIARIAAGGIVWPAPNSERGGTSF